MSTDDQLTLAGGFVGDIESEDSAIHFEIHFLVWESVVESPASYWMESVLSIASVLNSDLFEAFRNVVRIPLCPDAVPRFRRSRSASGFVPGRVLRGSVAAPIGRRSGRVASRAWLGR